MPDLFVDVGNSNIKIAAKKDLEWQLIFTESISKRDSFYSWLDKLVVSRVIVSSVIEEISMTLDQRYSQSFLRRICHKDIPRDLLAYDTPQSLGTDRFLTCFGASGQTSGNVVVIDSGSACTIDFMTSAKVYQGGVIMPGQKIMLQAISDYLPELPDVNELIPDRWPGKSSADSLKWGVTGAFIESITGFLQKYRDMYGDFEVYVTGGGSDTINRYLGKRFDVRNRPYLIFEGMELFSEKLTPHSAS